MRILTRIKVAGKSLGSNKAVNLSRGNRSGAAESTNPAKSSKAPVKTAPLLFCCGA